jgi:hypothetical protein
MDLFLSSDILLHSMHDPLARAWINTPYTRPTGKPKRSKTKCKMSKQSRKLNRHK